MLNQDTIEQQKELLNQHRRRVALLFQQAARLGDYAPPHVLLEIEDTQTVIRELKQTLSIVGIAVEDEPNDDARPTVIATPSHLTPQERRNRSRMLQKVRDFWIKGVLENSLHGAALIELGMEYKPDAVQHPWDMVIQQPDQPTRSLAPGTKIIEVFDELGGELLILGAPGSGKTTMLLELARDLIGRAEQDESYPMPVVFNLSSWAEKRQSLKEWLVEELNTKYDVPRKLAEAWVETDTLLLLLDGLDEAAAAYRGACVEAINVYRHEYGLAPLTVCSRAVDYDSLTTKLRLQGAILVQPLTQDQIHHYLERAGATLIGVREALYVDSALREMLHSPLMLSIVSLAYKDKPELEIPSVRTPQEWRKHLFDAYIDAMFNRRVSQTRYNRLMTIKCLGWLATGLHRQEQSMFFVEHLQPNWLTSGRALTQWLFRKCRGQH